MVGPRGGKRTAAEAHPVLAALTAAFLPFIHPEPSPHFIAEDCGSERDRGSRQEVQLPQSLRQSKRRPTL